MYANPKPNTKPTIVLDKNNQMKSKNINKLAVNVKLFYDSTNLVTLRNIIIATASFIIPYPKRTELRVGNFSIFTRLIAAMASVAHNTLARSSTSPVNRY